MDDFPQFLQLLKEYGLLPDCDEPLTDYSNEYLNSLRCLRERLREDINDDQPT